MTSYERSRKYLKTNPWAGRLFACRRRCSNINDSHYQYYGEKGIKCLLTMEEIKLIWNRDNACLMKVASIDRIDNDGPYELSNCRFIELSENTRRSNINNPRWITKDDSIFLFKKGIDNKATLLERKGK